MLVVVIADRLEPNIDTEVGGLKQQLLHHLSRAQLVGADKDAKVERRMDVGLADIQHLRIVVCKDCHHRRCQSRPVLPGDADKYLFLFHLKSIPLYCA